MSDDESPKKFYRSTFLVPNKGASNPTDRPKSNSLARKRDPNFLQKMMARETTGAVRNTTNPRGPSVRPFTRLPGRLAFCLKDAIPQSAIEAGHIFLGFSKCGQFLLSYTQTTSDIDLGMEVLHIRYNYRLHWWLFVPYRRAKKVSEIILFSNGGCPGNLRLVCSCWSNDMNKIVVFGHQILDGSEDESSTSSRCYITVTAVPSLKACQECIKVAANYEEDEMAAAWNSCVRLSCLEHGMTVHTSFDLVPPYPKFEPRISLKREGSVLVNSGNLLYLLDFKLEKLKQEDDGEHREKSRLLLQQVFQQPGANMLSELNCGTSELSLPFGSGGIFSPSMSDSDAESDASFCVKHHRHQTTRCVKVITNQERLDKVAEFSERLSATPPLAQVLARRIRHVRSQDENSDSSVVDSSRKRMAEKAYELTDDDFIEDAGVREKLSTFRKKRLADKKYEFTDEDSENVSPLPKLRSNATPQPACGSSATEMLSLNDVDFGMMDNIPAVPELLSPGGMVKKDQTLASPRSQSSYDGIPTDRPVQFVAKFTRRFIADDESVSVITEVEDDDDGHGVVAGSCPPLSLEVHGSGYQSMSMISNAKAGRISGRCVKVTQNTFDIELMCHDMAQKLCLAAGKKYWYCNDYDVEIVDLDPNTGDVLCVAVVLVMATVLTKRISQYQTYSISSLQRHQYQAGFKFCWNIDTGDYYVVDSEPLKEICKESGGVWHPARLICSTLQKSWGILGPSSIRSFTNDSVIHGTSLKTIVDSDHLVAIILDDLD